MDAHFGCIVLLPCRPDCSAVHLSSRPLASRRHVPLSRTIGRNKKEDGAISGDRWSSIDAIGQCERDGATMPDNRARPLPITNYPNYPHYPLENSAQQNRSGQFATKLFGGLNQLLRSQKLDTSAASAASATAATAAATWILIYGSAEHETLDRIGKHYRFPSFIPPKVATDHCLATLMLNATLSSSLPSFPSLPSLPSFLVHVRYLFGSLIVKPCNILWSVLTSHLHQF